MGRQQNLVEPGTEEWARLEACFTRMVEMNPQMTKVQNYPERQPRRSYFSKMKTTRESTSQMLHNAGGRTRRKGSNFPLHAYRGEVERVVDSGRCQLTGLAFRHGEGRSGYSPSLDQINPGEGYTPANTRVVLDCANIMMNVWGEDRILEVADGIRAERARRSSPGLPPASLATAMTENQPELAMAA